MPTYKTFPYKGFSGGLNLRDGVDVVPEDMAIDAMNVLFSTRGAVEQRSGYAEFTQSEGTNRYDSLSPFYKADGTKQLLAGAGNRLEVITTAGAVSTSTALPTANPHFFQRFGGPTGEHIYISNGTDTVRRWTGAAFETPTYSGTTPTGKYLALSVTDNRLVSARFGGAVAGNNASTVRFSAEGDPLTFGNTHYVDLTPGDGEEIMGAISWRDMTFVFKQTKFFVFYGNTVDDDGDPVFNYRPVDAGVGLVSPQALAVSEQGVYFMDRTGVYFTTGSQPARVSEAVEPIFHGLPSVYYTGGILNDGSISKATMSYVDEKLFLSFPSGVSNINDKNLVYDPYNKWWSLYNIPAGPMVNFRPADNPELVFGYSTGEKHLGRHVQGSYTADDMEIGGTGGTAISARWRSGWFNYGTASVKTIRELKLAGYGIVDIGISRDYRQLPPWTATRELSPASSLYNTGVLYDGGALYGPSTQIQPKAVRRAVRGETFSIILTNSTMNRGFKVNRLTTHVREVRIPSVVKVA